MVDMTLFMFLVTDSANWGKPHAIDKSHIGTCRLGFRNHTTVNLLHNDQPGVRLVDRYTRADYRFGQSGTK